MQSDKRKRSVNFSADEKMRFLRILQNRGKVIISKVTSHDIQTNRLKEEAWADITSELNASGNVLRTIDNLKKLWQKMKTEAKTFKSLAYNQTHGTGGGPSKKMDDPVLDLVAEITGRGSSGIEAIYDCDFEMLYTSTPRTSTPVPIIIRDTASPNTGLDAEDVTLVQSSTPAAVVIQQSVSPSQDASYLENCKQETGEENLTPKHKCLKRRRPALDHNTNERSHIKTPRASLNNNYASERLKCEKNKREIIELQKQHMIEEHKNRIVHAELKTKILETVLKKVQAAIPGLALIVGNILAPSTMARFGRRNSNIITIITLIIGWILLYFANSFIVLFLARLVQGMSMGMSTSLGSVLIGEYTSPRNRGAFLMTISVSIAIAVMSVHSLGSYLTWQNTALICGVLAMFNLLIVVYSPESPSWLAAKGRYKACEASFRWLRGDEEDEELKRMIQASMELRESKVSSKSLPLMNKLRNKLSYIRATFGKKEFYKPILIMLHIFTLALWSGINVLVAFPIDLFERVVGVDANMPILMMSIDAHRIIANALALAVIKKLKRRTLLFITVGINIIALLAVAGYSIAIEKDIISPADYQILGIFLVHIHMFSIATGSLPLCFILAGEIFPLEYRNLAGASVFWYSLNLFITVKTVPFLLKSINLHGTYLLYAFVMTYCLIVVYFHLPETKDKTLQDIEDEFRGRPLSAEELKSVQSLTRKGSIERRRSSTLMVL